MEIVKFKDGKFAIRRIKNSYSSFSELLQKTPDYYQYYSRGAKIWLEKNHTDTLYCIQDEPQAQKMLDILNDVGTPIK